MIKLNKQKNDNINFSKAAVLIMVNILPSSCIKYEKHEVHSTRTREFIDTSNDTGVINNDNLQMDNRQRIIKEIGDRLIENDGSKEKFERYLQTNPSHYEIEYIEKSLKEIENREALHFGFESTEEGLLAIEFSAQKLNILRLKENEAIYDFGKRLESIITNMSVRDILLFDIGEKGFKLSKLENLKKHEKIDLGNTALKVESIFEKHFRHIKENAFYSRSNYEKKVVPSSFQTLLDNLRIFLDELLSNSKSDEEKAIDIQLFFEKRYYLGYDLE